MKPNSTEDSKNSEIFLKEMNLNSQNKKIDLKSHPVFQRRNTENELLSRLLNASDIDNSEYFLLTTQLQSALDNTTLDNSNINTLESGGENLLFHSVNLPEISHPQYHTTIDIPTENINYYPENDTDYELDIALKDVTNNMNSPPKPLNYLKTALSHQQLDIYDDMDIEEIELDTIYSQPQKLDHSSWNAWNAEFDVMPKLTKADYSCFQTTELSCYITKKCPKTTVQCLFNLYIEGKPNGQSSAYWPVSQNIYSKEPAPSDYKLKKKKKKTKKKSQSIESCDDFQKLSEIKVCDYSTLDDADLTTKTTDETQKSDYDTCINILINDIEQDSNTESVNTVSLSSTITDGVNNHPQESCNDVINSNLGPSECVSKDKNYYHETKEVIKVENAESSSSRNIQKSKLEIISGPSELISCVSHDQTNFHDTAEIIKVENTQSTFSCNSKKIQKSKSFPEISLRVKNSNISNAYIDRSSIHPTPVGSKYPKKLKKDYSIVKFAGEKSRKRSPFNVVITKKSKKAADDTIEQNSNITETKDHLLSKIVFGTITQPVQSSDISETDDSNHVIQSNSTAEKYLLCDLESIELQLRAASAKQGKLNGSFPLPKLPIKTNEHLNKLKSEVFIPDILEFDELKLEDDVQKKEASTMTDCTFFNSEDVADFLDARWNEAIQSSVQIKECHIHYIKLEDPMWLHWSK